MPRVSKSKYTTQQGSTIRYNIHAALTELAKFSGIDTKTMQSTPPYSFELGGYTSQKITAELKKMIDTGMVVKEAAKGKTVKYMLRTTYDDLIRDGKTESKKFGYGDYRDNQKPEYVETEEEASAKVCERIALTKTRQVYEEMW